MRRPKGDPNPSASALGYTQITLQFELSRAIDGAVSDTLSLSALAPVARDVPASNTPRYAASPQLRRHQLLVIAPSPCRHYLCPIPPSSRTT